ncbi:MAG: SprT-like domain-containing protein [Chthonomonas sp.]|nr:SprT-like domain-containing protein [Chthonomonas sp.]
MASVDAKPIHPLDEEAREILCSLLHTHPLGKPITLRWRNYRTTAGTAEFTTFTISLSKTLMTDAERLRSTLVHEYAHLLAFARHGLRGRGHGPAWRQAMVDLGETPTVRHRYDCQRNRTRHLHIYVCVRCREQFKRGRLFSRGRVYIHKDCGGKLNYLQKIAITNSELDA